MITAVVNDLGVQANVDEPFTPVLVLFPSQAPLHVITGKVECKMNPAHLRSSRGHRDLGQFFFIFHVVVLPGRQGELKSRRGGALPAGFSVAGGPQEAGPSREGDRSLERLRASPH